MREDIKITEEKLIKLMCEKIELVTYLMAMVTDLENTKDKNYIL